MAGLVEIVRPTRPELVVNDSFAATLDTRVGSARAAWRDIDLDPERFVHYLATRLEPPTASVEQLHVEDLFLACACLEALPRAQVAFDRACGSGIDLALSAAGVERADLPAMRQQIQDRLLSATPPKLASYAGRGSLGSWVRIFAMREAARLLAAGAPA
ncbi:hypothetical protein BH11MYX3_BH11MYX3_15570 [soil metagenome]